MEEELQELRTIAADLRLLGEVEIVDKVLCAIAALTDGEEPRVDLSYSYVMRELRKDGDKEKIKEFQKKFKDFFDMALDKDIEDPANVALLSVMEDMNLDF